MRYSILILLYLIISSPVIAQEAPKKANLISVKLDDNIDSAFRNVGRLLLDEGYELATADKVFYAITTEVADKTTGFMKPTLEIKFNLIFNELEDGTSVDIKLMFLDKSLGRSGKKNFDDQAMRAENRGAKSSALKTAWKVLDNFAKKIDGGSITYIIEEE